MSELISGKEALIALSNGEEVQFTMNDCISWHDSSKNLAAFKFLTDEYKFRLKSRTITLNGIEVPAPFEPKKGEDYFYLTDESDGGYDVHKHDICKIEIAAWRTEEEIKQVVAALRSVFGTQDMVRRMSSDSEL